MDETAKQDESDRQSLSRGMVVIWAIIAICVGIEAVLTLADYGLIGPARLRLTVYEYAGFWPALLHGWRPNYTGQSILMFFTYAFVHGGILHVAFNMATLWSLGRAVVDRVGAGGMLALYTLSALGGGAMFALLTRAPQPMVGASGALFGLAGGLLAWNYVDRFSLRIGLWPVARVILLLIGMNVVMWWALRGQLAWETHLGGFLTGWIGALLIDPRSQYEPPEP